MLDPQRYPRYHRALPGLHALSNDEQGLRGQNALHGVASYPHPSVSLNPSTRAEGTTTLPEATTNLFLHLVTF